MPATPARRMRELDTAESKREEGRRANEAKYTEFKLGCDEGQVSACNSLGEWWAIMRQDFEAAARLYTPACLESRHPQACLNLGQILGEGEGEGGAGKHG
jgi:TPR repeat protein